MPRSIRVDADFQTHRRAVNDALNSALENRRSYLGFVLSLTATVVVVLAALGWTLKQAGVL